MRVVVDMQGAQTESKYRGIGRYSISFIESLVTKADQHQIVLLLNGLFESTIEPIRAHFDSLLPQSQILVWFPSGETSWESDVNIPSRQCAELLYAEFVNNLQPDLLLVTSIFEGCTDDAITLTQVKGQQFKTACIFYDLIPLIYPEQYLDGNPVFEKFYRHKISQLKHADYLLAISASAAGEAIEHLGWDDNNITNVSAAVDDIFQDIIVDDFEQITLTGEFGIVKNFILYTGATDERKNLYRLIQAFALLPKELRQSVQLVVVGRMPIVHLQKLELEVARLQIDADEIIFTSYVNDIQLVNLYNLCSLFVLPSTHEGFGLPVLEAMSCGAPVIGSNASSIPEVIQFEEALFDPLCVEAISQKIQRGLEDDEFRLALIENSKKRAPQFSWAASASSGLKFLESKIESVAGNAYGNTATRVIGTVLDRITKLDTFLDLNNQRIVAISQAIALNHPSVVKLQLFVDVSELNQRDSRTGVQRVARSVLLELLDNPPSRYDVRPVYGNTTTNGYMHANSFMNKLSDAYKNNSEDEMIEFANGDVFLGLDLQHSVLARQTQYLDLMRSVGVSINFVVYDLLPILMPQSFRAGLKEEHTAWLLNLIQYDGAVCISAAVAKELAHWISGLQDYQNKRFDISWFHLGADVENSAPSTGLPNDAHSFLDAIQEHPTFLMVGTVEPRKGHRTVFNTFEALWGEGVDVNLVIVGIEGWLVNDLVYQIENSKFKSIKLFWLQKISDEYLGLIYANADCLIAASEGEGFGLPLIEAARVGLPIIARDIPVFKEVASNGAYYFDGRSNNGLKSAIQNWLQLFSENKHPPSSKVEWLTWKQSTSQLLKNILPEAK